MVIVWQWSEGKENSTTSFISRRSFKNRFFMLSVNCVELEDLFTEPMSYTIFLRTSDFSLSTTSNSWEGKLDAQTMMLSGATKAILRWNSRLTSTRRLGSSLCIRIFAVEYTYNYSWTSKDKQKRNKHWTKYSDVAMLWHQLSCFFEIRIVTTPRPKQSMLSPKLSSCGPRSVGKVIIEKSMRNVVTLLIHYAVPGNMLESFISWGATSKSSLMLAFFVNGAAVATKPNGMPNDSLWTMFIPTK